jgi:esterase FrsA
MSYEFTVDTRALFSERYPQWANLGLPAADLDRVRAAITTMWADEPGGWTYELSAMAREYAGRGDHYLACLAYGVAKFPVLADEAKREAQRRQADEYATAAPTFGARFERRILQLPYRGATTPVPVHLLSAARDYSQAPVLLFSGGLDSWKMDLHPLAVGFDHPGTGETQAPLDAFADEVIRGLISEARQTGNGKTAHFGLSFGGNFSAMSGLSGAVDAAIDLGGPVDASFEPENLQHLMFGMADIGGNAYGFTAPPHPGAADRRSPAVHPARPAQPAGQRADAGHQRRRRRARRTGRHPRLPGTAGHRRPPHPGNRAHRGLEVHRGHTHDDRMATRPAGRLTDRRARARPSHALG